MRLSGPILGAALRMLPTRPIKQLWFALALDVLAHPTVGEVAPDLGLFLNRAQSSIEE